MDKNIFETIWGQAQREAANRSKGRFMRAVKYGTKTPIVGQNKGLQDAPRAAVKTAVSVGVGLAFVPIPFASAIVGSLVATACDKVADIMDDYGCDKAMEKLTIKNRVQKDVEELKKNTLPVIDRNIAKLNAAQKQLDQAVNVANQAYTVTPGGTDSTKDAALRAVAEVWYYTKKLRNLVQGTQETLSQIDTELRKVLRRNKDLLESMQRQF